MANRGYTDRETRLALEWAARAYPGARVISRYRILTGQLPNVPGFTADEVARLLKPTGLMADLVLVLPEITIVVEAKTDNETQAIGQLLYYVFLMQKYPELQEVPVAKMGAIILLARRIPDIVEFANKLGVQVAFYTPDWIRPFLQQGYVGGA